VLVLHSLANLVPLAVFEGLGLLGWDGRALGPQSAVAIAGAGAAVALTLLAARRLGSPLPAAIAAAALMAVTLGAWRAGGSAGVYGLTLAVLAAGWLIAAGYVARPSARGVVAIGAAGGLAVATHLLAAAFLVGAAVLVVFLPPRRNSTAAAASREDRLLAFATLAGAALAVAGPILLFSAGLATDWRPELVPDWFVDTRVAPGDASTLSGFGLSGLVDAVAADAPLGPLGEAGAWITAALSALALTGWWIGIRAGGARRVLVSALLAQAVVSITGAGERIAHRGDYFSLALIPLALLWATALGAPAVGRWRPWLAAGALVAALALGAWNLDHEVQPSLEAADRREEAVSKIDSGVPDGARVLLSSEMAPLAAYRGPERGFEAETGWAPLLRAVAAGAPPPGLERVLAQEPAPVAISSRAFDLNPEQLDYLEETEEGLWEVVRSCCVPRPVATFETGVAEETLYLLGRDPRP
jgi:hypothetical protein